MTYRGNYPQYSYYQPPPFIPPVQQQTGQQQQYMPPNPVTINGTVYYNMPPGPVNIAPGMTMYSAEVNQGQGRGQGQHQDFNSDRTRYGNRGQRSRGYRGQRRGNYQGDRNYRSYDYNLSQRAKRTENSNYGSGETDVRHFEEGRPRFDSNRSNQNLPKPQSASKLVVLNKGKSERESESKDSENVETLQGKDKSDSSANAKANQSAKLSKSSKLRPEENKENQRGALIDELTRADYECMVCCGVIRCETAVWSCQSCYHIFHLFCIKKWARSSAAVLEGSGTSWRCPGCQNITDKVPNQYRCFCGKRKDPEWDRQETPHSCGEVCRKKRKEGCVHPCNILCHPGPCPTCQATITKSCNCGKTKQTVKCSQGLTVKCTKPCGKTLNCGKHECQEICHAGACQPCEVEIKQSCFCGGQTRSVLCGSAESFNNLYTCGKICNKSLDCGHHNCEAVCHPGACAPCPLMPSVVTQCPCGKTPLADIEGGPRQQCTDPVPTCKEVCGKRLQCGSEDSPHFCDESCHVGPCGPCQGTSSIRCQCGAMTTQLPCSEVAQYNESNPYTCEKRCNKKKQCGRHKCSEKCCVDRTHVCNIICGRKLTCGLHKCEEVCHRGNCPTCWHVSFDELTCYCGTQIMYPPIPCGTRPPECFKKCSRPQECGHEIRHNCHPADVDCAPCTTLTQKWCMGGHEKRNNIACHITDISCGLPCNKPLPCGLHKCKEICHKGPCLKEGEKCGQPCTRPRSSCEHPCMSTCHGSSECPDVPCKAQVVVKCVCGNRSEKMPCMAGSSSSDFQRVSSLALANSVTGLQSGQVVDITSLTKSAGKLNKDRKLDCNEECARMERNRRMALALQIKNPDLQGKLGPPPYTDFLKDYARQHPTFVARIEKDLAELVQTAKQSKQPRRSHGFAPMNRDQRRTVHELAEFYGCETQSYDNEPKKNVVATAIRDKSWLPSETLTALIQRELHPKAPPPIPHGSNEATIRSAVQATKQSTKILDKQKVNSGKSKPVVDYFDMTEN